ncbi:hypothetical protein JCM11491_005079 [Sporobolomyces phaffii]
MNFFRRVTQSDDRPRRVNKGLPEATRSTPSSSSSPSSTSNPAFSPALTASTENDTTKPTKHLETGNLATRLQELAIANADGLLDDDEYRLLRQQVFETHSNRQHRRHQHDADIVKLSQGTVAVPRLNDNVTSSAASARSNRYVRSPESHAPTTPPMLETETLASPVASPLRTPSIVSHQSKRRSILPPLNSLFRRDAPPSSSTALESDWDVVTPPLSSPNDHVRSLSPLPLPLPLSSDSSSIASGRTQCTYPLSSPTSPVGNRSIRNHAGMASAALDTRASSSFAGTSSRSSTGRSYYGGAGGGARSFRSGAAIPRSPTSTRTRSRYAPTAGGASHGYSSNYSHDRASAGGAGGGVETLAESHSLPPITSSTDPLLFAATGREPTVQELEREIREIEDEWARMRQGWTEMVERRVAAWEREVGPSLAQHAREFARSENATNAEPPRVRVEGALADGGTAETTTKKGFFKRASILPGRPPRPTTLATSGATESNSAVLPQFLLSSKVPLPPELESKLAAHQVEPTRSLRIAMDEIVERQRRTEDKYERRLEFLRAKEKGARIKQRLLH